MWLTSEPRVRKLPPATDKSAVERGDLNREIFNFSKKSATHDSWRQLPNLVSLWFSGFFCLVLTCWKGTILKNKIIFSLIDWRKPHPVWLKNILPDGCKNIHSMLHFSLILKNILNPLSYFLQHTETTELNCLLPAACPDSCRLYTATGWLE